MKKRPLAFLCLAAAMLLSLIGNARGAERDRALEEVQEILAETAGTDGTLTFEGTVTEINAVSEGIRLSVNSIILYTNEKPIGSLSSDLKLIMTIDTEETASGFVSAAGSVFDTENAAYFAGAKEYLPGDRIRATGTYRSFEEAGNPGQFDSPGYYFAQNTVGRITSPEVTGIQQGTRSLKRMLARFRRALRYSYLQILEEKAARTVSAISLGEKSFMEQEWKQLYQEGGIAHIISISGLHISMIGMCIYSLLRRMRLPFFAAAPPAAAVVVLYAMMSGFGISSMRASLMFAIWLGSQIVGRKYDMLTAAAVAAAVILAGNGQAATQSSFLLSFGAILSIALLVPRLTAANPFRRKMPSRKQSIQEGTHPEKCRTGAKQSGERSCHLKKALHLTNVLMARGWDALSGGAGVWLGTLPITLWFFYQTAPWSILVNLAVIPLMSALMASGLVSCLAGLVSVPLGTFLAAPVYYLLRLFEGLCTFERQLPCAIWIAGCPAVWKIAAYYALLVFAAVTTRKRKTAEKLPRKMTDGSVYERQKGREKPGRDVCSRQTGNAGGNAYRLWLAVIAFGICLMAFHPRDGLTAVSMDVGQGDGALIMLPDGINCLIDGGSSSVSGLWEYRISQTVKYYGISRLDYVFLSHADSDHISGIQEYLEDYLPGFAGTNAHGITVRNLVLPLTADETDFAELITAAADAGITVLRMEAGGSIGTMAVGTDTADVVDSRGIGWSLTCLAPSSDALSGDKNEDSMVLLLQYGSFRMLYTGDLEGESETALAASGANLSCDVLKVGHHGSKGASSEEFLAAAAPSFGIISCGKDNSYGHPATAAVERLRAANITLYTTMDCGALIVRSNGSGYRIAGYRKTVEY